jgi:hypothetical protein
VLLQHLGDGVAGTVERVAGLGQGGAERADWQADGRDIQACGDAGPAWPISRAPPAGKPEWRRLLPYGPKALPARAAREAAVLAQIPATLSHLTDAHILRRPDT